MAARKIPTRAEHVTSDRAGMARLVAVVILLSFARNLRAEDWPRWRGPRGDGIWQGPALPDKWPAAGLKVRWRYTISGGYAGVSVADGLALVTDRVTAEQSVAHTFDQYESGEVERLMAFDIRTGLRRWTLSSRVHYGKLDYGNGPRAAPTVYDGRVYTLGALGYANCVDANTGARIWSKKFVEDVPAELPEWGLAASPVIFEDLVILHPGAKPGGCLVALDRQTGNEVWRAGNDPAGYATPILIRHRDRPLLIAWTPEHVLGIDPRTGEIHWSVPYKVTYGVSIATPIHDRDIVFVTGYWEGAKAIRLGDSPTDARLLWEDDRHLRCLMSQPLVRDGYVYALDKQHGLTCFELETGKVLWNDGHRMTPRGRNPQATLVWHNDRGGAIVLNAEGELILARLDPDGYHEQSRTKIIGPTWAHPAYAGNCVFARDDTELVCIELPASEPATTKP